MSYAEDMHLDARLTNHHIRRGSLSRDEHNKYLDSLPDDADNAEETLTRFTASFASRLEGQSESTTEE